MKYTLQKDFFITRTQFIIRLFYMFYFLVNVLQFISS